MPEFRIELGLELGQKLAGARIGVGLELAL